MPDATATLNASDQDEVIRDAEEQAQRREAERDGSDSDSDDLA